MEELMHQAIRIASKIANQYKILVESKKDKKKKELKKAYVELHKLLTIETELYKLFDIPRIDAGIEYIHQNYPNVFLNLEKVLSNEFSFLPIYRVYSRLNSIQELYNYYNEMHTKEYNANLAYTYLFQERFIDSTFRFFEKAKGIKKNSYFIETKYNLIFSYLSAENRFWHSKKYASVFPLNRYLKFLDLNGKDFIQKMDEQLDNFICNLMDSLTQEQQEKYYESEEFYNQFPLLEFEFRIFYFLIQDVHIKIGWQESIDSISKLTEHDLIRLLLKNIVLGISFDEDIKLQLQNKL